MAESDTAATRAVTIGVADESAHGERRVSLVPAMVERLGRRGNAVVVAPGAGSAAYITDEAFSEAGARQGNPLEADVLVCVTPPTEQEVAQLRDGTVLIGFLDPLSYPERAQHWDRAGLIAFAMESIPRISRAQGMDALSSQANVAGYRAALTAAQHLPRFVPMMTTAAGTMKPAKALVLGAGVAGLQALATAKRLGAQVTGYDVRPEVADQVRSVGAQWLDLGIEAIGEGGYARELTESERADQQRRLTEAITGFDVVITTALVPGKRAPTLVTAEAVRGMPAGGVVVDLAGETGGNCELTEPGELVTAHEVMISSPLNLPAEMPAHASELYARNIIELLELILDESGRLVLDASDEIISGACIAGGDKLDRPPDNGTGVADASAGDGAGNIESSRNREAS